MMDCANGCAYGTEIERLKADAERNSTQHREFYDKISEFTTKQAIVEERYNNILKETSETKLILTELKDKPAKKWDNLSWLVISSIVTGIIGYLVGAVI